MHWLYSFLFDALTDNLSKVRMFRRRVDVFSRALTIILDLVLFSWNSGDVQFIDARKFKYVDGPKMS